MADIFISYSTKNRDLAAALAAKLKTHGFSVWWDSSLIGGQRYREQIHAELRAAQVVIVIWTSDSAASKWVQDEAEEAERLGKLVPLRLSALPIHEEVPLGHRQTETLPLDNMPRILAALATLGLGGREAKETSPNPDMPKKPGERTNGGDAKPILRHMIWGASLAWRLVQALLIYIIRGVPLLWRLIRGPLIRTLNDIGNIGVFSPDGRIILTGQGGLRDTNYTLKLWSVARGKELRTFVGHTKSIKAIAFSPDNRFALSASYDTTLRLWDVGTGKMLRTFAGQTKSIEIITFAPDGHTALSLGSALTLWDVATGDELGTFAAQIHNALAVTYSPDGRSAVSACNNGELNLWDVASGKMLRCANLPDIQKERVWSKSFGRMVDDDDDDIKFRTPDFRAMLGLRKTPRFPNLSTDSGLQLFRQPVLSLEPDFRSVMVTSLGFSPDGHIALAGSDDGTLRLCDVATGGVLRTFSRRIGWRDWATMSIWDSVWGFEQRTFRAHTGQVRAVALSPDGRTAISCCYKTLKLWDVASGKELRTFSGDHVFHRITFSPAHIAFSSDGRTILLSASAERPQLWDLKLYLPRS